MTVGMRPARAASIAFARPPTLPARMSAMPFTTVSTILLPPLAGARRAQRG